jgi:hypothetical protein
MVDRVEEQVQVEFLFVKLKGEQVLQVKVIQVVLLLHILLQLLMLQEVEVELQQ